MVVFGFSLKFLGRWQGLKNGRSTLSNVGSLGGYHEVVGTLKPYFMQKNLFECFALTGGETQKNFGHKCSGYRLCQSLCVKLSLNIFSY